MSLSFGNIKENCGINIVESINAEWINCNARWINQTCLFSPGVGVGNWWRPGGLWRWAWWWAWWWVVLVWVGGVGVGGWCWCGWVVLVWVGGVGVGGWCWCGWVVLVWVGGVGVGVGGWCWCGWVVLVWVGGVGVGVGGWCWCGWCGCGWVVLVWVGGVGVGGWCWCGWVVLVWVGGVGVGGWWGGLQYKTYLRNAKFRLWTSYDGIAQSWMFARSIVDILPKCEGGLSLGGIECSQDGTKYILCKTTCHIYWRYYSFTSIAGLWQYFTVLITYLLLCSETMSKWHF